MEYILNIQLLEKIYFIHFDIYLRYIFFPVTGASCHTTFNCMKSDIQTQLNKNIS